MIHQPGDRVHIVSLGTGIVRETRNGGRYLIEIKGATMIVAGSQLTVAAPERRSRTKKKAGEPAAPESGRAAHGPVSLDLHGKTVDEAIEALDVFLNEAILDGRHQVTIIHGRGSGRVKAAVRKRLGQLLSVRAFPLDPANPGATIVTF